MGYGLSSPRLRTCATRKFVVVEQASSPFRTGKMPVPQSNIFIVELASSLLLKMVQNFNFY